MELFKNIGTKKGVVLAVGTLISLTVMANGLVAFAGSGNQSKTANSTVATATYKGVQLVGIKINGKLAVVLANKKQAETVLEKFKLHMTGKYTPRNNQELVLVEPVEVVEFSGNGSEIITEEQALSLLEKGKLETKTYTVLQGENLWAIARKNNMHVADILAANPSIKGEFVDVGQTLNLVKPQPMIHTNFTTQVSLTEAVPFTQEVIKDSSIPKGTQKVKQEGKAGEKEVTYKVIMKDGVLVSSTTISQKVTTQPQKKIILKRDPASRADSKSSRGDDGEANLSWPVRGDLSSPFGERWGKMHTGLDISGNNGATVRAASGGTVISAGWDGGYGKMVSIRHENGLVTRYAHLASIEVSDGDSVSRGDAIGVVGSTGHVTGPHLHFEVMKGGDFRNPIGYLR